MKDILNNSKDGLRIFQERFENDYSLPKYEKKVIKYKNDITKKVEEDKNDPSSVVKRYSGNYIHSYEDSSLLDVLQKQLEEKEVDLEFFRSLDAEGLALLIDEQKKHQISKGISNFYIEGDSFNSEDIPLSDIVTNDLNNLTERLNGLGSSADNTKDHKIIPEKESWWSRKFGGFIEKLKKTKEVKQQKEDNTEEEKKYVFDILEFFKLVKMNSMKESSTYFGRIEDYLKAIRQAQSVGQQALVDKLLGNLFITKYESILRAQGCSKRITEKTLVDFIKKTEKGVSLCYLKNYTRPIPKEVIDKKLEADKLKVFDNYCILYFDPEGKVYGETAADKQKAREKREDPILFGMIEGIRNLYYVTDWIDEYCDLTLDKFVQTLGISKESLEIETKIKLW